MKLLSKAETAIGKEEIGKIKMLIKQEDESKILFACTACGFIVLFVAFILTWLGIVDLKYVNEVSFNYWIEYIGHLVMFMINVFFMFSITLNFYKYTKYLCIGYIPLYMLAEMSFSETMIASTIIPIIYLLLVNCFFIKIKFKNFLLKGLFANIIMSIITFLLNTIKNNFSHFRYFKFNNCLTVFIYSIDLYLFYFAIYKGVRIYDWENVVRLLRFLKSNCKKILSNWRKGDVSDLTNRQRYIFFFLVWSYLILQSTFVLGINLLINKLFYYLGGLYIGIIELICLWIMLEIFRSVLGKTYHNKDPIICNKVSLVVVFVISRFSLPFKISLLFNIVIVAIVTYLIHVFVIKKEQFESLFEYKHNQEEFNLKTCTSEQLTERCRLHGFSKEDTELAIKLFVDKIKLKEAAALLNIELQSMKNKKGNMAKTLNSTF